MANMSSASGNVKVVAYSEDAMKAIIKTYQTCVKGEYCTYLDNYKYELLKDGSYLLVAGFCGDGRWAFECNIQAHFKWCVNGNWLTPDEVKLLEGEDFTIEYDFTDYEPGCLVFYNELCDLVHKKGVPLEDTEFVQLHCDDLDMSWGNRLREELEDEGNLVDMLMDMETDELVDFLDGERASLEEYFGKSLEDRAEEYKKLYRTDDWIDILKKYESGKAEAEGGR